MAATPRADGVHWLRCDLGNRDDLRAAVAESRPAVVLHAAGFAGTSNLRELVDANVITLANLLEALHATDLERLVVVGSAAEYAPAAGRELIRKDDPLEPSNRYGLSKLFQFELSRLALRQGTPVVY